MSADAVASDDRVALGIDLVLFHPFHANRLERAVADVQRHAGRLDARGLERGELGFGEVQARGGRGDRATLGRVHGLVALVVGCADRRA